MYQLKHINIKTSTNGSGLWSQEKRKVDIKKITVTCDGVSYQGALKNEIFGRYGELRAYFSTRQWDTRRHGLIYTDVQWLREFRKGLRAIGFSQRAVRDVHYSEQGMQEDDYVSMDVGEHFIRSFEKIIGEIVQPVDPRRY